MHGEARIERGSVRGCAAGSFAVDDGESGTASAGVLFPFLYSGVGAGVTLIHRGTLDLSARPQWLARRVSEVQTQLSLAFIDLPLADGEVRARVQMMPVTVETAYDLEGAAGARGGRQVSLGVSMVRFAAESPGETGSADFFVFESSWVELETTAMTDETLRLSLLRFERDTGRWSYGLDGGVLIHTGAAIDCETSTCSRGAWAGHLIRRSGALEIGGRTSREGFVLWDGSAGYEYRIALETTLRRSDFAVRADGFAARTRRWLGDSPGTTGGIGGELVVPLGAGFSGLARAEVARSFYAALDGRPPELGIAAHFRAALTWRGSLPP
jgi:hypothetical protein